MANAFHWFKTQLQITGLVILGSLWIVMDPAVARRYQPPTGDPPDSSVSNGSRPSNCDSSSIIPLTVLAPLKHVGRTSTLTPTFAWFVPAETPYRLNLSLYTLNTDSSAELLHELEYVETNFGINHYTLPDDKSELQFGQRYFLQVSLACQPNQPRYDQSFIVQFDTQAPPETLSKKLSQTSTPLEKSDIYAEAGYWYDALGEIFIEANSMKDYPAIQTLLNSLAPLEETNHGEILTQISNALLTQKIPK